jgi:cyanobactin maturation PatA/PatG family protease
VGQLNVIGAYNFITQGESITMSEQTLPNLQVIDAPQAQIIDPFINASEAFENVGNPLQSSHSSAGVQAAEAGEVVQATSIPNNGTTNNGIQASDGGSDTLSFAVPPSVFTTSDTHTGIQPQGCDCSGGQVMPSNLPQPRSFVFTLGTLGYDFGTEARRDSFKQLMPVARSDNHQAIPADQTVNPSTGVIPIPANPYDARQMVSYLETSPSEARSLIWTLNLELTPIYAIEPQGSFAASIYQQLTKFLRGQVLSPDENEYVQRVSLPGILTNRSIKLFSGQVVPVIELVNTRGMYSWTINELIQKVTSSFILDVESRQESVRYSLDNFLNRIYYDLRNLGQTSAERALNFAATNAFQFAESLTEILKSQKPLGNGTNTVQTGTYQLANIDVEKSPFCRMDSDCWDIKLIFFDPENNRRARKVLRYTIDVSDYFPVTLGKPKIWDIAG